MLGAWVALALLSVPGSKEAPSEATEGGATRAITAKPFDFKEQCFSPPPQVRSHKHEHDELWRSAGSAAPSNGQFVSLYTVGGHYETYEVSLFAVQEGPGRWRLSRVARETSHIPVPPPSVPRPPTVTSATGEVSIEDSRALEAALSDEAMYSEPSACTPKSAPGIGVGQEWLEIRWNRRTRLFETFGVSGSKSGMVISILWHASAALRD